MDDSSDAWYATEEKLYYLLERLLRDKAAVKIQALRRGRSVRQPKGRVQWRPKPPMGRVNWRVREGPVLQQMTKDREKNVLGPVATEGLKQGGPRGARVNWRSREGMKEGPKPSLEKQLGAPAEGSKKNPKESGALKKTVSVEPRRDEESLPYKRVLWRKKPPQAVDLTDRPPSQDEGAIENGGQRGSVTAERLAWREGPTASKFAEKQQIKKAQREAEKDRQCGLKLREALNIALVSGRLAAAIKDVSKTVVMQRRIKQLRRKGRTGLLNAQNDGRLQESIGKRRKG